MSMDQFLQALNYLPQIVDGLKKMNEEEKQDFVNKLGLQGAERENALKILNRFQKGEPLTKEEQEAAQELLLQALEINELQMADLLQL
ncbi:MAG TPA: hypothetical protein PLJ33_06810 [Peptococcaceae bacterium]|jgi:hypothetical protein|nr:hypothetical protein [Clostridia bacterium]HOB81367.1 hypothetical protein [Peptococcaceae bacterium]HPZ71566.1 hypothetical protein [Peptococcaceae bacterium]HQD54547.1 hypothetical protein [Peptococcaceae bacterium]